MIRWIDYIVPNAEREETKIEVRLANESVWLTTAMIENSFLRSLY